ncbi:MAG: hypothetical protein ACREV2_13865 [Burkholderiales bacterium]
MDTVVLKKVKASELPGAWRKRIKAEGNDLLTVTIAKTEAAIGEAAKRAKDSKPNHSFGMWADRDDVVNASVYARALRRSRY